MTIFCLVALFFATGLTFAQVKIGDSLCVIENPTLEVSGKILTILIDGNVAVSGVVSSETEIYLDEVGVPLKKIANLKNIVRVSYYITTDKNKNVYLCVWVTTGDKV